ncbi:hypothetical protein [Stieleria marina]
MEGKSSRKIAENIQRAKSTVHRKLKRKRLRRRWIKRVKQSLQCLLD